MKHQITQSFKKIRVSTVKVKENDKLKDLFEEREQLKGKLSSFSDIVVKDVVKDKLEKVDSDIADIQAEHNYKTIKEQVEHLVDDTDNLNCLKMWQLKKKLGVKKKDVPITKKNEKCELVTNSVQLKKLYESTYKKRLEHRMMKPELVNMYKLKMNLFDIRLEVSKSIKSQDWTEENLLNVLKTLKKNKSADSDGLIYELFRPEVIGSDLFSSLLMLCNKVKSELVIPKFVTFTDITSIYKNKGDKNDLENDRGIFGVSKVRSIIEKLIYEEKYHTIDDSMSDSNVGGRKKGNIRDNLLVIYATINEAVRNKKEIDIQFYDLAKCFDAMWAEETMNDRYDAGVQDENFALISMMNETCQVKVKTPVGDTERFQLNRIEMQGTVPAPLKCAVQIDTLGKYCYTYNTGCYVYKESCYVPPLGMIDDIAGIAQCKDNSIILNSIVNSKIESKKLQFNLKKCVNMHIGPHKEECDALKIHDSQMLTTTKHKYLGDIVCSSGNNQENIKDRCKTGQSAISQIKSLMNEISLGKFSMNIGLILRDSIFLSKMLLNSEVWHSLTKCQIVELEVSDRMLMRYILNAHSKTGLEWIYSDTGRYNLKSLIQIRRLMYQKR